MPIWVGVGGGFQDSDPRVMAVRVDSQSLFYFRLRSPQAVTCPRQNHDIPSHHGSHQNWIELSPQLLSFLSESCSGWPQDFRPSATSLCLLFFLYWKQTIMIVLEDKHVEVLEAQGVAEEQDQRNVRTHHWLMICEFPSILTKCLARTTANICLSSTIPQPFSRQGCQLCLHFSFTWFSQGNLDHWSVCFRSTIPPSTSASWWNRRNSTKPQAWIHPRGCVCWRYSGRELGNSSGINLPTA